MFAFYAVGRKNSEESARACEGSTTIVPDLKLMQMSPLPTAKPQMLGEPSPQLIQSRPLGVNAAIPQVFTHQVNHQLHSPR